ncbi:hypothetical protein ATY41_06160 [Leifsonia xyli subsp. xyli]|uniref:FHA domain-containing protein n=2 Tax=Leifsonia xyli subsp. xyli TaxID=59736 RepID=Q6ABZ0_LEIXX|nr:FHA domain-containing protein [Leifsonia xyli]AAT90102.1 hypothetical protein Lxx24930 [Leifsonia xyli subsp. xyli str. CTCB07]ODA89302.1 hypothetical protein ATY41_06160 [Leifsonia xyli subsp. xyli]
MTYVGRNPSLPAEADERRSSLVAVGSGTGTVEETHAQLTAGDGLVLVRDLWSAGGTMVEQPNGAVFRLSPGEQIPVARGARILLGDGVVLETVGLSRGIPAASARAGAGGLHRCAADRVGGVSRMSTSTNRGCRGGRSR